MRHLSQSFQWQIDLVFDDSMAIAWQGTRQIRPTAANSPDKAVTSKASLQYAGTLQDKLCLVVCDSTDVETPWELVYLEDEEDEKDEWILGARNGCRE